jgi:nucleoside-diphosphate-sugar epimerase
MTLQDEKILFTGLTGQIGFPMATFLAENNEVWGLARYSDESMRARVEEAGITPVTADLAGGNFSEVPADFTYLVHLAAFQGPGQDYDWAITVNGEGTGLLMQHCAAAKGALIASTFSVYKPDPDPYYQYTESDPLGDCHALHSPAYSVSKIAQEASARLMARAVGLPTTIARINASYSAHGGLPAYQLDWLMNDQPVGCRAPAPSPYNPIHQDDMNAMVEPLLAAASSPATIVNWCGDETVTVEEWCTHMAGLAGKPVEFTYTDFPGAPSGGAGDPTKRHSITGPCTVTWQDGMTQLFETRYPNGELAEGVRAANTALTQAFDD